jgi:hypothetical protein
MLDKKLKSNDTTKINQLHRCTLEERGGLLGEPYVPP